MFARPRRSLAGLSIFSIHATDRTDFYSHSSLSLSTSFCAAGAITKMDGGGGGSGVDSGDCNEK